MIVAFGNLKIYPVGSTDLILGLPNSQPSKTRFVIMPDDSGTALLGLQSCIDLGFVKLNEDIVHHVSTPVAAVDSLLTDFADVFSTTIPGVKGVRAKLFSETQRFSSFHVGSSSSSGSAARRQTGAG